MSKYVIEGGNKIEGEMYVKGAKNAALPIMAACLLTDKPVLLERIPNISDVRIMIELLKSLGVEIEYDGESNMTINCRTISTTTAPYELVKKIHASFDITGPLLARFHHAKVSLPGGCVIGTRAVNLHVEGFQALGAKCETDHGFLIAETNGLIGNKVYFHKPSVGATKNVMMAAALAKGKTVMENAACEPEIIDLANFLNRIGCRIKGAGTVNIEIEGVKRLRGCHYKIISDRIEAGTYLLAAAVTGGDLTIKDMKPEYLESFLGTLDAANQEIITGRKYVRIKSRRPIKPIEINTAPFPGFPTDLHPPMAALLTVSGGTSIIEENIFDGRYNYVDELRRMGAEIKVTGRTAVIEGKEKLTGAPVDATDIRAGGALVIAGLVAEGITEVNGAEYIDRGYQDIDKRLCEIGGKVKKVD